MVDIIINIYDSIELFNPMNSVKCRIGAAMLDADVVLTSSKDGYDRLYQSKKE
jgi:cysteine synthase